MKQFIRLLFLTYILVMTQGVYAKEIKFVQITDSHFSSAVGEKAEVSPSSPQGIFEKAIDDVNTVPNLDFVVFTGDNIDQSNETDLKEFLLIANRLKVPYYVVIGNHEVFKSQNFTKNDYMKTVSKYSKNCRQTKPNYVFEKGGLVFIVVDGAKEIIPGPAGYYKKDTLKWLDKQLTKYKYSKVVIFQHFPIVEPYYHRSHTTYNKQDYEAVLKNHKNVIGIFSGHYHSNAEQMVNGVYHVSTPALIAKPHEYKIVEIEKKGRNDYQIYTQLRHAE